MYLLMALDCLDWAPPHMCLIAIGSLLRSFLVKADCNVLTNGIRLFGLGPPHMCIIAIGSLTVLSGEEFESIALIAASNLLYNHGHKTH